MDRANILTEWEENEGKRRIKYPQAFTVRLSNLYCVGQRCRDIRGSYRSVLLLIVPRGKGIEFPTPTTTTLNQGVGHDGERKRIERDGVWVWVWGRGMKGDGCEREKEKRRKRLDDKERMREKVEGKRQNGQGTQRALVFLTGR